MLTSLLLGRKFHVNKPIRVAAKSWQEKYNVHIKWVVFVRILMYRNQSWQDVRECFWIIFEIIPIECKDSFDCISITAACHNGYWRWQCVDQSVTAYKTVSETVSASVSGHQSAKYDQRETQTRTRRITWLAAHRLGVPTQELGDNCDSTG
jgi:hypothetical protein